MGIIARISINDIIIGNDAEPCHACGAQQRAGQRAAAGFMAFIKPAGGHHKQTAENEIGQFADAACCGEKHIYGVFDQAYRRAPKGPDAEGGDQTQAARKIQLDKEASSARKA